jgi:Ca-activated chloride channel homolog
MPTSIKIVLAMMTAFGAATFLFHEMAHASSYGTLEEAPAGGGELRLIAPKPATKGAPTHAGQAIGFPLQHTEVTLDVHGVMASVVVEQTFSNPYQEALDAVYVFPMGPDAAVHGYSFTVGERLIEGQIAERDDAREIFEEARASGHTAGLLHQEKPNVFTQELANLPPGEEVVVRLEYVELVDFYDAEYEVVFPMVVGPRFLPANTSEARPVVGVPAGQVGPKGATKVSILPPGVRSGHDINVELSIDVGVPLTGFSSTSHALVDGGREGTRQRLSLDPGDRLPNKDLVVRWSASGEKTAVGVLAHRADKDGFVSVVIQPKAAYTSNDVASREVVLLIDASGSMSGGPMDRAKDVARGILSTLRPNDEVQVLAFSDSVVPFRDGPVPADSSTISSAIGFVDGLSAGGSTQMLAGVHEAIAGTDAERVRVVYLLSDGEVGNDDEILGALERGKGLRVYPVGIGSAPNRYLFERTAERSRGFATYVTLNESADDAVRALVERSTRPYLTDLEIDWGGLRVTDVVPESLPDVQAGQPLVISGRYPKAGVGVATLRARLNGKIVEVPVELELPEERDQDGVAYLWARRRIHEIKSEHLGQPDDAAQRDITDLGMQFGLVTDYTSFVAVDRERVIDRTGHRQVDQAVELPEGMDWKGLFSRGAQTSPTTTASNPVRVAQNTPQPAARNTPRPTTRKAAPPASKPARKRSGGSYGGGNIDPISGLLLLGLGVAARRRKQAKRQEG